MNQEFRGGVALGAAGGWVSPVRGDGRQDSCGKFLREIEIRLGRQNIDPC